MKLYLISQAVNNDYDTYSDAVVAAESDEEAKRISPSSYYECGKDDHWFFLYADGSKKDEGLTMRDWCPVKYVNVELIGEAIDSIKKGIICSSFHAG